MSFEISLCPTKRNRVNNFILHLILEVEHPLRGIAIIPSPVKLQI